MKLIKANYDTIFDDLANNEVLRIGNHFRFSIESSFESTVQFIKIFSV